ncbi:hypothetical protein L596_016725 [Steinernema carpocapsae]|uniref:Fatty acid synthase n=1 Tax=Steinernema carpocapsae TaxID=34508 RepID=A0A4U5NK41_STECR|nr:hypothetical protein L596_016725 [Steinernema carpocapsae]
MVTSNSEDMCHEVSGAHLSQLIKASHNLYGNQTLFITLRNVHQITQNTLTATAVALQRCDIFSPFLKRQNAKIVSHFQLESFDDISKTSFQIYGHLVTSLLAKNGYDLTAMEMRFPISHVDLTEAYLIEHEDGTLDMILQTGNHFPAVQILGLRSEDHVTSIVKATVQEFIPDAKDSSSKTFQFLGMDSLQIANFEFALKTRLPGYNIPFGTCLKINTISKLVAYLKESKNTVEEKILATFPKFYWHKTQKVPLSASQKRFLFLNHFYPDDKVDQIVETFKIRLPQPLRASKMTETVNSIIARHTILRTFYDLDEQLVSSLTESFFSLSTDSKAVHESRIDTLKKIPVRISLIDQYLHVSLHHIATDGTSIALLAKTFLDPVALFKEDRQYADFASYENSIDFSKGLAFWKNHLKDLSNQEVPKLGENCVKAINPSSCTLSLFLSSWKPTNVTPFATFLFLYKVLIYKLYGHQKYPLGIAVSNRNLSEVSQIQGCFVNIIVLVSSVNPNLSIEANISAIGQDLEACLEHQNVPFDLIVSELNMDRNQESPFFDVLFILDDFDQAGLTVEMTEKQNCLYKQIWKFKKTKNGGWELNVEFRNQVYEKESMEKLLNTYARLLKVATLTPQKPLKSIGLDRTTPIFKKTDFPKLHPTQIIDQQLTRGAGLVSFKNTHKNLSDIYETSKSLAASFHAQMFQQSGQILLPDDPVALYVNRDIKLLETILAIWHLGAAVVPLSRDWPEYRVKTVLKTLDAFYILDSYVSLVHKELEKPTNLRIPVNLQIYPKNASTDLLYLTYTSGSTGTPKAVCTEALGLPNLIMNYNKTFFFGCHKTLYQVVNYGFDIFFADILQVFFNGGSLRLAENRIPDLKEMAKVTHAYIMPAYLAPLENQRIIEDLEVIQFGGEALCPRFKSLAISRGLNMLQQFGITEHTVYSHVKKVKRFDNPKDIGKAFENYEFMVSDKDGLPIPNGFEGQFNTGGVGLFRGYLRQKQAKKSRMFNTGDLMIYKNGQLTFHGRADSQVKINGYRIELGEIEAAILKEDKVKACVVMAEPDLVIFVVLDKPMREEEIQGRLGRDLPYYMVPQKIELLDKMPLNSNGKIDRLALATIARNGKSNFLDVEAKSEEPNHRITKVEIKAIKTRRHSFEAKNSDFEAKNKSSEDLEKRILAAFLKYSKAEACFGPQDNIFHHGVTSIHILLALQELKETHHLSIDLRDVFKLKTVKKIAANAVFLPLTCPKAVTRKTKRPSFPIPATFNQQAQWFLSPNSDSTEYLLSFKLSYKIGFNMQRLLFAINAVISKHKALRTIVYASGSEVCQESLSRTEAYFTLSPVVHSMTINVSQEIPVKIGIHEETSEITVVFHHIAVDGASLRIIVEDLGEAYKNSGRLEKAEGLAVEDLERSFSQESLEYWKTHLQDDRTRSNSFRLTSGLTGHSRHKLILNLPPEEVFIHLIAAYALLLSQLTSQSTVTFGVPFANRSPKTQYVVGNFVNTICLKINTNLEKNEDYISHVKDVIFEAHKHQAVPFDRVVKEVNQGRDYGSNPLFSTMLVYNDSSMNLLSEDLKCSFEVSEVLSKKAKFEMTWFVEGKDLRVEYHLGRYEEKKITDFVGRFQTILQGLTQTEAEEANNSQSRPKMNCDAWNDYPSELTFGHIFNLQTSITPSSAFLKLSEDGSTHSYQDILKASLGLAFKTRKMVLEIYGEDLLPDDVVAICYREGLENHLGIIVAFMLGCTYVPLDPNNPKERNRQILADSGARILLCSEVIRRIPCLDIAKMKSQMSPKNAKIHPRNTSTDLVYMIYTSGTTGTPKGVCIQTKGVLNTIENVTRFYNLYAGQTILQYTKYAFDASIAYTYGALSNGSCLVISSPEETIKEPLGLLHMTPILLKGYDVEDLKRLEAYVECFSVGGDVLPDTDMNRVVNSGIPMVQVYGPTEATVLQCMSKMKKLSHSGRLIGKPISNFGYALQGTDQERPQDGEFLMSGPNLARGYKNTSKLSDCSFLFNRTVFKSGDYVFHLLSGHFIYLHRIDGQRKVRGYRVDLSEVENALADARNIGPYAADLVEENGENHIVVWYAGKAREEEIRNEMIEKLPHYMQASFVEWVEKIPVNSSSKVDKTKLRVMLKHRIKGSIKCPQIAESYHKTLQEDLSFTTAINSIWAETLKKDSLPPKANFYAEGGHSIKAALICHQIKDCFKIHCPVELVFKHPILEDFIMAVKALPQATEGQEPPNKNLPGGRRRLEDLQLTVNPYQKYLLSLFANEANENRISYNNELKIKIDPSIRLSYLQTRLNAIIMHQTAMRSRFIQNSKNEDLCEAEKLSGTESYFVLRLPHGENQLNPFYGPPLAISLKNRILKIEISHVIEDGQSFNILIEQLLALTLPETTFDYYRNSLKVSPSSVQFWTQKTENFAVNRLEPNPFCSPNRGLVGVIDYNFPDLMRILKVRSQEESCSIFVLLLQAIAKVVKPRTGKPEDDFSIGTPVDLRSFPEERQTVGYYVNTLPLIFQGKNDPTVKETKAIFEEAYEHRFAPYEAISKEGVFDVMLAVDNVKEGLLTADGKFQVCETETKAAKFPVTFYVSIGETLKLRIEYKPQLFHKEYIEEMVQDWVQELDPKPALKRTAARIDMPRSEIPTWATLSKLLISQVTLAYSNSALKSTQECLNYESLLDQAYLKSALFKTTYFELTGEAIKPDLIIPIISQKSIKTTLTCLAIILSGAAYTPIDVINPWSRIQDIMNSLKTNFYVADKDLNLPGLVFLNLSGKSKLKNFIKVEMTHASDLAYVINTSGTQGKPKSVAIEHRSLVNLATQSAKTFSMKPSDVVYYFTNFAYDNSVLELVMALTNGATLFYPERHFTADKFISDADACKATHALLFPGLVNTFLDSQLSILATLRYWIVGAEKLTQKLLDKTLHLGTNVIQNYGPTESTTYILWRRMKAKDYSQNLGIPIDNASFWTPAPSFKTSLLHLGGDGLLRGYLNLQKQPFAFHNRQKFLPTGDLVKRLPTGQIYFVGRTDSQVKIRGQRVDLSEVEETLLSHNHVKQAKVLFHEEEQKILAFYTSSSPNPKNLLAYIKQKIPIFMVPSALIHVQEFPMTSNAKVNQKALLKMALEEPKRCKEDQIVDMPKTMTEFQLWTIFKDVFQSNRIGINDDFFLLGGNSLNGQVIVDKIRLKLRKKCTQEDLYRHSAIKKLGQILDTTKSDPDVTVEEFKVPDFEASQHSKLDLSSVDPDLIPLSYQQEQMLFLHSIDKQFNYNMPFIQAFPKSLTLKRLHAAFHRLIQQNQILRTVIIDDYQRILSMTEIFFPLETLKIQYSCLQEEALRLKNQVFDLSESILRAQLYETPEFYVVCLVIQHIATDATTTNLIEEKLSRLYEYPTIEPPPVSYAKFAKSQKGNKDRIEDLAEKAVERLRGHLGSKSLRLQVLDSHIELSQISFQVNEVLELCAMEQVTPYVVFLSLLCSTLKGLLHSEELRSLEDSKETSRTLLIGSPVSGRDHLTRHTLGLFLNNVIIIAETANIQVLKAEVAEAMAYSLLPFNALMRRLNSKRSTMNQAPYDVYFNCRYGLENEERLSLGDLPKIELCLPPTCTHPMEVDVDQFETHFKVTVRTVGCKDLATQVKRGLREALERLKVATKVKKIVADLLKLKPEKIVEEDNFFDLGGDSLLLLKLRNTLAKSFGKQIDVEDLLASNQRIIDFVRLLNTEEAKASLIIPIHTAEVQERVVIFLPPLIGGSHAYGNLYSLLSKKLKNASLLAVNLPDPGSVLSIEALAGLLIQELKPYLSDLRKVTLIGASFGGILCYEIARQLSKPLMIISIDSTAKTHLQKRISFEDNAFQIKKELKSYGLDHKTTEKLLKDAWEYLQLSYAYKPTKKIKGQFHQLYVEDPKNGWDGFADVESRKIQGDHSTMLMKQNAEDLSDIIYELVLKL